jgi:hypothetical protein
MPRDRGHLPDDPDRHRAASGVARLAGLVAFALPVLLEHQQVEVGQQVAEHEPAPARQVAEMAPATAS